MGKKKTNGKPDRLKKIEGRLIHLERMLEEALSSPASDKVLRGNSIEEREIPVEPWHFLVRRQHPWRKQLYLKGRNLTARQLVGSIQANQLDVENAAENYHLPIGAVREALVYVEKNLELLQTETEIERLMQKREGVARARQSVP